MASMGKMFLLVSVAIGLNIHGDHWYGLDDVIGAIKNASVEDDTLHIDFLDCIPVVQQSIFISVFAIGFGTIVVVPRGRRTR